MKKYRPETKAEIKKYKICTKNKPYINLDVYSKGYLQISYGIKYLPLKLFINILLLLIGCFVYGVSEYWSDCIVGLFDKFGAELPIKICDDIEEQLMP